jgi:hypothetical protein
LFPLRVKFVERAARGEAHSTLFPPRSPFTLDSWAGREIEGLHGLTEQVRLFGETLLPRLP